MKNKSLFSIHTTEVAASPSSKTNHFVSTPTLLDRPWFDYFLVGIDDFLTYFGWFSFNNVENLQVTTYPSHCFGNLFLVWPYECSRPLLLYVIIWSRAGIIKACFQCLAWRWNRQYPHIPSMNRPPIDFGPTGLCFKMGMEKCSASWPALEDSCVSLFAVKTKAGPIQGGQDLTSVLECSGCCQTFCLRHRPRARKDSGRLWLF